MTSNPFVLATLSAIGLGAALVPWSIVIKKVGDGPFFVVLGLVFIAAGLASSVSKGADATAVRNAVPLMLLTAVLYVGALWLLNQVLAITPQEKVPVVSAVLSTFPVFAAVTTLLVFFAVPSLTEGVLMAAIVLLVVLFSLVGRH